MDAYVLHGNQYMHLGVLRASAFTIGSSKDKGGRIVSRFIGESLGSKDMRIVLADDIPIDAKQANPADYQEPVLGDGDGTEYDGPQEGYPSGWQHCTIHLNPITGEMHSDGDHRVRIWIQQKLSAAGVIPQQNDELIRLIDAEIKHSGVGTEAIKNIVRLVRASTRCPDCGYVPGERP